MWKVVGEPLSTDNSAGVPNLIYLFIYLSNEFVSNTHALK